MKHINAYENDRCIGCGVCRLVCPADCISIVYNARKEYEPRIDKDRCINCGECDSFCVHSADNVRTENERYDSDPHAEFIGLDNSLILHSRVSDEDSLMESTSGGIAGFIAIQMLRSNTVDIVIHAVNTESITGEEHYKVIISKEESDIRKRRGTVYGPLRYDRVFETLKDQKKNVLLIGTPCIIRSAKRLFTRAEYSKIRLYTCALVCSHNVSGQFTDAMADHYSIGRTQPYRINLRKKRSDMRNADHFFTELCGDRTVTEDRFESPFTALWRSYAFAMGCCIECRDFWGREADISLKDAWGAPGRGEKHGSSIAVIRNEMLKALICGSPEIKKRKLDVYETMISQKETLSYKQKHIRYQELSARYRQNATWTKEAYMTEGIIPINAYIDNLGNRQPEKKENEETTALRKGKIFLFGGFAGSNQGDEAQIDETYRLFKNRYPDYEVVILSQIKEYTRKHHMNCEVADNSRVAIWNCDDRTENLYKCDTEEDKRRFRARGEEAVEYARSIAAGGVIDPNDGDRMHGFVRMLHLASLIVFSGGGYLTGRTLSRLWDHLYVMEIANILSVPYILTGQTIGLWDSGFSKEFALKELRRAEYISLRDAYASPEALREIGLPADRYVVTHDDALFCRKKEDIRKELSDLGVRENAYIVFHAHFWGVKEQTDIEHILTYAEKAITRMLKRTDYDILLLPMTKEDIVPLWAVRDRVNEKRVRMIRAFGSERYDFAMIRALIAASHVCVTMKHHPIVFAMGELIPVIALCYRDYYVHKNTGALDLFGQGSCAINIEEENAEEKFYNLFDRVLTDYKEIKNEIRSHLADMESMRDSLFSKTDELLGRV